MANVDETQRHESLPIESVTYERKKEEAVAEEEEEEEKRELSGIQWIVLCLD